MSEKNSDVPVTGPGTIIRKKSYTKFSQKKTYKKPAVQKNQKLSLLVYPHLPIIRRGEGVPGTGHLMDHTAARKRPLKRAYRIQFVIFFTITADNPLYEDL